MAFWSWSKTAASNATADSTINWAEGMPPAQVNDSGRAMMARTAEWRDDVSGTITTGGTSTAYTVASNQVFDSLAHMAGAMIAFVPHTTSGATVTLNVDGLGAKPLRAQPSIDLPTGVLIQGTPYVATYNNSDGVFYLQGFYGNPYNIPIGGLMPYLGSSAPNSSFVLPFGQTVNRTTYATLFSLISTTFGPGDGSTTFGLPDLRGRGIMGLDNMGGSAASRITVAGGNFDGTVLGGTGGAQNHTLSSAEMPSHTHTFTGDAMGTHSHGPGGSFTHFMVEAGGGQFGASGGAFGEGGTTTGAASAGTPTGTNANTGGGGAHTILNPCMVMPFILRVI